jgi:hypothetical protein
MVTVFRQQLDALTTIIAALCAVAGGVMPGVCRGHPPIRYPGGSQTLFRRNGRIAVDLGGKTKNVVQSGNPREVGYMKEHSVSRLMSVGVRSGIAKAAVAGALVAMPMVGVTVAAYAAPGDGTSGPPAPPGSSADPHDPGRPQAPRAPTASPSHSNSDAVPTGPNDPKCVGMPHYPACEGNSSSGPHHRGAPADPGRTRAPRAPTASPSHSNSDAVPTGPNDPKCVGMPHYPACEGDSSSGPHHRGEPADPGGGRVPRTPTSTTPTRTSSRPAPPNPDI